jgi:predicted lactoylglutathione lyase
MYCSPNKQFDSIVNTCFELNDLIEITKAYNKFRKSVCVQNSCIKFNKIDVSLPKNKLYKEIQNRLLNIKEYKWIELEFLKNLDKNVLENIKFFTFKPKPIKTKRTWFDTDNINEILQQYQLYVNEKYGKKYYKYLGAQPADISRLQNFNWAKLQNKYKYVSIVFNIDKHTSSGQHWVACFIDNITKTVEYFDSLGKDPNRYIGEFLKHFEEKYIFKINNIAFQDTSNLCGLYSCWFIIMKLNRKTFKEIQELDISDAKMYKYLKTVFRPK